MDEFPNGFRGGRIGKLLDVLRHRLRGIQGDEDNISRSYVERGLPVPAHIAEPPKVDPNHSLYWTAYADLQHERPQSIMGGSPHRITWSSIANYARHHSLNVDEMKRVIWALDSEFIGGVTPAPETPPDAGATA